MHSSLHGTAVSKIRHTQTWSLPAAPKHSHILYNTPVSTCSILAGVDTFSHYTACWVNWGHQQVLHTQWMFSVASIKHVTLFENEKQILQYWKLYTHAWNPQQPHRASKLAWFIGWGVAPMFTHAPVILKGWVRTDVQCMPYNKVGVGFWFGFYFLWMNARDIQSLWDTGSASLSDKLKITVPVCVVWLILDPNRSMHR